MGRYYLFPETDPNFKLPKPGKYYCSNCNKEQIVRFPGQKLCECPRCHSRSFSTV